MLTKFKFLNTKKLPGIYHIFTEQLRYAKQNKTSRLQFVNIIR